MLQQDFLQVLVAWQMTPRNARSPHMQQERLPCPCVPLGLFHQFSPLPMARSWGMPELG